MRVLAATVLLSGIVSGAPVTVRAGEDQAPARLVVITAGGPVGEKMT